MDGIERWLPILSLPGYEVSSKGRVRQGRRIVKSRLDATGTHVVNAKCKGVYSTYRVARLVAEMFCRDWKPGKRVKFLDGNHTNYNPANLQWVRPNEGRRSAVQPAVPKMQGRKGRNKIHTNGKSGP